MRVKIDWASLIVGKTFTVFACFALYLRATSKYKPPEGRFNGGFFALSSGGLYLEGLMHGGAYFRNFMVYIFF